jgi:ketosteroid isomerase-like protein
MPLLYLALRKVETRRPTVTHDDVRAWLNAYVEAWRTYDPAAIGALFTEDATYAYHPWDGENDLVRGRDAIVANWLEEQDKPGSWEAQYRPLMVEGERAVATGTTRYANGKFYWNLFVLRFGGDGRCAEFVEWYMTEPPEETSQ